MDVFIKMYYQVSPLFHSTHASPHSPVENRHTLCLSTIESVVPTKSPGNGLVTGNDRDLACLLRLAKYDRYSAF